MDCRYDQCVWLFGRGFYFANCENVKICPESAHATDNVSAMNDSEAEGSQEYL